MVNKVCVRGGAGNTLVYVGQEYREVLDKVARGSYASLTVVRLTRGGAINNSDALDALIRINDVLDAISEQLAKLDARITRMADGETVAHTETINAISDLARAVDTLDLA